MTTMPTADVSRNRLREIFDEYLRQLFPICRSITGNGVRETLCVLSDRVPLEIVEVPSGTAVFDWKVPPEWNIRDAWVKDSVGTKVVDFQKSNLAVVNYSEPIHKLVSFEELDRHLYSLAQIPSAIPYRTSYFKRNWGFCLPHEVRETLDPSGQYEVYIDSSLNENGTLTFGEAFHQGATDREILISTYCCHPSLANDNLSGLIMALMLFDHIRKHRTHFSYRLVVVPETIGALAFLHRHQAEMHKVVGGTVVSTVGGPGRLGLKHSFNSEHWLDRLAVKSLELNGADWIEYPFRPDGSDERQYSSPGFRIPTISITKDKYYEYSEYHTSLDDLDFVSGEQMLMTYDVYETWFDLIELNRIYRRSMPYGEFQLGKRGLYPDVGGSINQTADLKPNETDATKRYRASEQVVMGRDLDVLGWLMFGCDGETDLLSIAERSGLGLYELDRVARELVHRGLLTCVEK